MFVTPWTLSGMVLSLSFSTLLFEVILTRLFAYVFPHHFIAVAVSLALLGLGLGAFLRLRFLRDVGHSTILQFGLSLLSLSFFIGYGIILLFPHGLVLMALGLLPFVILGTLISQCYEASKAVGAHRTYFFDLLGGAMACLVSTALLNGWGPLDLCFALSGLSAAIALVMGGRRLHPWNRAAAGILAAASGLMAVTVHQHHAPDVLLKLVQSSAKGMVSRDHGRVVDFAWSAMGRADICEMPGVRSTRLIYNDASNPTVLLKRTAEPSHVDFLKNTFAYLPFAIALPKEVLILGSGAGLEVTLARFSGASQIHAVEVNPATIKLVRKWRDWAGPVYERPGVTLYLEEGRLFLSSHPKRYDLIQMSLVLTATAESGTYALVEGYLYTVEAFRLYLARLHPTGMLAVIDDSPARALRQFLTALAVLEEKGKSTREAMRHLCVLSNARPGPTAYKYLMLWSPMPFSEEKCGIIKAQAERVGAKPEWIPGLAMEPPYEAIFRVGDRTFIAGQTLNFQTCFDDAPFSLNFAKGFHAQARLLYPLVMVALLSALAAVAMPRFIGKGEQFQSRGVPGIVLLLGAGFMLVEMGLLQKLARLAGGPSKTLPVLLFSLLFWCGLGSQVSKKLTSRFHTRVGFLCLMVALVNLGVMIILRASPLLETIPSAWIRFVLIGFVLSPIGLALGMPFPTVLRSVGEDNPALLGLLWCINGISSVAGALLSIALAFCIGIEGILLLGSVVYLTAAWVAQRASSSPEAGTVQREAIIPNPTLS